MLKMKRKALFTISILFYRTLHLFPSWDDSKRFITHQHHSLLSNILSLPFFEFYKLTTMTCKKSRRALPDNCIRVPMGPLLTTNGRILDKSHFPRTHDLCPLVVTNKCGLLYHHISILIKIN